MKRIFTSLVSASLIIAFFASCNNGNEDTIITYKLSVSATEGGTVEGDTISNEYFEGDSITLKAIANPDYYFVAWSDSVTDNPRTLIIYSDTTIVAQFAAVLPYAIDTIIGTIGGYKFVGLGLPSNTLWATCNVGADTNNVEKDGGHFAWGETEAKTVFNWGNYKLMTEGEKSWKKINKYQIDDKQYSAIWYNADSSFVGDSEALLNIDDDAASKNWGDYWVTPTLAQWKELRNYCYWVWTDDYNGAAGFIVYAAKDNADKGKKVLKGAAASDLYSLTDIHIFLPAAGYYTDSDLLGNTELGSYWSSDLSDFSSGYAFYISISGDNGMEVFDFWRNSGRSIRPVRSLLE